MKMMVTGGCGFIGSNFIKNYITHTDVEYIVNVDCLTYAGNLNYTEDFKDNTKYYFYKENICCQEAIRRLLVMYNIDTVVHFAAETHVDNSISGPSAFIETNVGGTYVLLAACLHTWNKSFETKKFINVSTDEVYGSLEDAVSKFTLDTPYKPNSPYSATKAAGDFLCRSFHKTYNFPSIITNCCNNYGPNQHPEKFIPRVISKLKTRDKIPVYGTGKNIREWIHVDDHCNALWTVITKGTPGEQYLIGTGHEIENINLAMLICRIYDEITGENNSKKLISYVNDRAGHDFRYALDSSKIRNDLKWNHQYVLSSKLKEVIEWYIKFY